MGESFDHRPAGWIRQSRKCCIQLIHNHMVVNYPSMSSVDFGVPDFCVIVRKDRYRQVGFSPAIGRSLLPRLSVLISMPSEILFDRTTIELPQS
jgi:hypothetical protein